MALDLATDFDDLDPDEADLFDEVSDSIYDQGDDYDWYDPSDWGADWAPDDWDVFDYDPYDDGAE